MKITNPYESFSGNCLKGALHNHSTNSDGEVSPIDAAKDFERLGFDFMALTDHNRVPDPEQIYSDGKILVIPGCEYRGEGADSEIGVIGVREQIPRVDGPAVYVAEARKAGEFIIYNHPKWHICHWHVDVMNAIRTCDALEVYNAVCDGLPGPSQSEDVWDRLLTCGYRVLGVATDDAHAARQRNRGWVMVDAEKNEKSILDALKQGRFYSSSGVEVTGVSLEGNTLKIESENAQEIRFFADRGKIKHIQECSSAEYEICEGDIFVRVELYGTGAQKAWLNPLFVETDRSRELSDEFNEFSKKISSRTEALVDSIVKGK